MDARWLRWTLAKIGGQQLMMLAVAALPFGQRCCRDVDADADVVADLIAAAAIFNSCRCGGTRGN